MCIQSISICIIYTLGFKNKMHNYLPTYIIFILVVMTNMLIKMLTASYTY